MGTPERGCEQSLGAGTHLLPPPSPAPTHAPQAEVWSAGDTARAWKTSHTPVHTSLLRDDLNELIVFRPVPVQVVFGHGLANNDRGLILARHLQAHSIINRREDKMLQNLPPPSPPSVGHACIQAWRAPPAQIPHGCPLLTRMLLYMLPLSTARLTRMMQQSSTCWL